MEALAGKEGAAWAAAWRAGEVLTIQPSGVAGGPCRTGLGGSHPQGRTLGAHRLRTLWRGKALLPLHAHMPRATRMQRTYGLSFLLLLYLCMYM